MVRIRRILARDNGQTSVDYMLMIALVAIAMIAAVNVFISPTTKAAGALAEDHADGMTDGRAQ